MVEDVKGVVVVVVLLKKVLQVVAMVVGIVVGTVLLSKVLHKHKPVSWTETPHKQKHSIHAMASFKSKNKG
jgi:hypothetical protein